MAKRWSLGQRFIFAWEHKIYGTCVWRGPDEIIRQLSDIRPPSAHRIEFFARICSLVFLAITSLIVDSTNEEESVHHTSAEEPRIILRVARVYSRLFGSFVN
ncbi:hypothetical protein Ppb6_00956 [Photorhabdus australis subsp. thailandensis]|uniref:Uncharacterized protein n=1 Tax=Photorhabdus australis subsp. thailandensis TaxID=2805096 RepID=A0A1C0U710_9GAMM|nr:hypothetical protein [Photorhabdus australis]OCQ53730.1 hypothetical protein Ppb6_00956 [Photorhabdus australis subsp. thailandensis]